MSLGKKMYARYQDTIKLESGENTLKRVQYWGICILWRKTKHYPTLQEMYITKKSSM